MISSSDESKNGQLRWRKKQEPCKPHDALYEVCLVAVVSGGVNVRSSWLLEQKAGHHHGSWPHASRISLGGKDETRDTRHETRVTYPPPYGTRRFTTYNALLDQYVTNWTPFSNGIYTLQVASCNQLNFPIF